MSSPDVPQIYPYKYFTQENIFTDDVLQIRRPLDVEKHGNTLEQLASMLSVLGVEVEIVHSDGLNVDTCGDRLVQVLSSEDRRVIVDIGRKVFGQKGDGHFSPVAAYNATDDQFLIMDVARYKHPPFWVPAKLLYEALRSVDRAAGRQRGFLILARR